MCGIGGIVGAGLEPAALHARLAAMQGSLRHRGPDSSGLELVGERGGLVHTRLAILDLSPAGQQPMTSDDGRYTLVFNGEIYNFADLREELVACGERFRGQSDTEVLLRLYARDRQEAFARLRGMYAAAIWDRVQQSCTLVRGPMGIKPLYYWTAGPALAFASEMRALLLAGLAPVQANTRAMYRYLLTGAVQEPDTLVEGIAALPHGHYATWRAGRLALAPFMEREVVFGGDPPADPVATTRAALEESVQRHFVSDVPVGIFLSGGIDSNAVLATAVRCGFERLRTFSLSFQEEEFNEGQLAARSAAHFGTEHVDWRMSGGEARALFGEFLEAVDVPSVDGFNTFCIAKLAHDQGAKVVLSGVGGDELFGGYQSFRVVPRLMDWHGRLNRARVLRIAAQRTIRRLTSDNRWQRAAEFLDSSGDLAAAYGAARGIFTPAEAARLVARRLGAADVGFRGSPFGDSPPPSPTREDGVSYLEITRYLRNQLLRDSDVMSMAWGLELRTPLVDRTLLEAIKTIPAATRLAPGKRLLVEATPELPPWIAAAKKKGFAFPFAKWLQADWHDVFQQIEAASPVPLRTWYRRWVLFMLDHCLARYGLDAADRKAA